MHTPTTRRVAVIVGGGLTYLMLCMWAILPAGAKAAPLMFGRCSAMQVVVPTPDIECATLVVPLDDGAEGLGNASLAVQRIAADGPQMGTIVLLAGGPGQPALPIFEELLAPLSRLPALRDYELVSFDQRGTGQSGALTCPAITQAGLDALTACGDALGVARADYTSQDWLMICRLCAKL